MSTHRARRDDPARLGAPRPHLSRADRPAVAADAIPGVLAARLAVAGPSPDFADRLRGRLVAVATVAPAAAPRAAARPTAPRLRWVPRAAVGGMAGVVVVAGVGVATSHALPGQPLYGAKRQVESWQLALHHGSASRGREELAFARTRLAEVRALSAHHSLTSAGGVDAGATTDTDGRIASTLRTMDAETRSGASDLTSAARSGDATAARTLLSFATAQTAELSALSSQLPASAEPAAAASTALLAAVRTQAATLAGSPSGGSTGTSAPPPPGAATSPPPAPPSSPAPTSTASGSATSSPTTTDDVATPTGPPTPSSGEPEAAGTTAPPTTSSSAPPTTAPTTAPTTGPVSTPTASPTTSAAPPLLSITVPDVTLGPVAVPTISLGPVVVAPAARVASLRGDTFLTDYSVRPHGRAGLLRLLVQTLSDLFRGLQGTGS